MSDADIPDRLGPAVRWVIASIALFVFFLIAAENFNERKILAGAINAGLFIVTFIVAVKWYKIAVYFKERAKVGLAIVGALALGIAVGYVGATSGLKYLGLSTTGKIALDFEQTAGGFGYFLNMVKVPNQEVSILGFQAHGRNTSKDPISRFSGYIRSDISNVRYPIYILAQDNDESKIPACSLRIPTAPEETYGIPGFADFDISTYDKTFAEIGKDGVSLTRFLNNLAPFTVVLEYDDTAVARQFSREEIGRQVDVFEKSVSMQSIPRVLRRATAKPVPMPPLHPLLQPPQATPIPPTSLPKLDLLAPPDVGPTGAVPSKK
jgi:hypothetical protein